MPRPLENLNATVDGCQQKAAIQAETAAAMDAKLLGILGFVAAAAGLLLTVNDGLESYRWILLAGAGIAILVALEGIIRPDDVESGPDPIDFFEKYGEAQPIEFADQLFVDFREVLNENKGRIKEREEALSLAFASAVSATVAFGLVQALAAILA
jgi:hypothetical protein